MVNSLESFNPTHVKWFDKRWDEHIFNLWPGKIFVIDFLCTVYSHVLRRIISI